MRKKQLCVVELDGQGQTLDLDKNKEFQRNFQQSILLSLLEKEQLTQWQYDCCVKQVEEKGAI
ncbi:hypothetical protein V6615_08655 [Oscillospiraceae bacterium PP1C4]